MANMRLIAGIIAGAIAGGTTLACGLWENHQAKKEEKNKAEFLEKLNEVLTESNEEFLSGKYDERPYADKIKIIEAFIERSKNIDEEAKRLLRPSTCTAIMCESMKLRLKLGFALHELKMAEVGESLREAFNKGPVG